MTDVSMRAVASLIVGFNFFATCFTLECRHLSSKENTHKAHNKFVRQGLRIKATHRIKVKGVETISQEAKGYSKSLLVLGNLGIALWIVVSSVACWFYNPLLGWLFLILAFVLIFAILRRLGCNSCYYCKSCTMGFGKLADLFFGSGHMAGLNSSIGLKIVFGYGLLGIVPIVFLTISIMEEFAAAKIAVLALLLVILLFSGIRRKPK
jgi:hypothetical protein